MNGFFGLIARDIRVSLRESGALATALGFYVIVVSLVAVAVGPDRNLLGQIAAGVLWLALLLSALLSLGRIFETDYQDGSLEILVLGALPLELVAMAKALAHWLTTGLPLVGLTPLLSLLLNLDVAAIPMLLATMLVGTLAISMLGTIAAALTLRSRAGGALIAILVLPLYVPTLIYGVTTVSVVLTPPGSPWPSFLLLSAISLCALVFAPWASASALRHQMQ